LRSDVQLMWFGSGVVIVSAIAFVFSIGLVVAPAALALIAGSLLLARTPTTARH